MVGSISPAFFLMIIQAYFTPTLTIPPRGGGKMQNFS